MTRPIAPHLIATVTTPPTPKTAGTASATTATESETPTPFFAKAERSGARVTSDFELRRDLRDLATSLLGDPLAGDAIMRRALRRFVRYDREQSLPVEEAVSWLNDEVLALCLRATGCVQCALDGDLGESGREGPGGDDDAGNPLDPDPDPDSGTYVWTPDPPDTEPELPHDDVPATGSNTCPEDETCLPFEEAA
jgi:hypothetical protein